MVERQARIESIVGLHARPAAVFVQAAARAPMDITIAKPGGPPVNAKSILAVLGLDIRHGERVVLSAEGDGADSVLEELATLVTSRTAEAAEPEEAGS